MSRSGGPTAEQRYREAYERGIKAAAPRVPFAVSGKVGSILGPALRAHATNGDGKPLEGEAVIAWIERKAEEFRKATSDRGQFFAGWSPYGFTRWLNEHAGEPASARPGLGTFQRARPGDAPVERRPGGMPRILQRSSGKKIED